MLYDDFSMADQQCALTACQCAQMALLYGCNSRLCTDYHSIENFMSYKPNLLIYLLPLRILLSQRLVCNRYIC
jgi:hypothetical protein